MTQSEILPLNRIEELRPIESDKARCGLLLAKYHADSHSSWLHVFAYIKIVLIVVSGILDLRKALSEEINLKIVGC
jgi:hypothetical protein